MTGFATLALQQALYAKLTGDATLMTLVDAVYDHVPESAAMPYVTIGGIHSRDYSTCTTSGQEHRVALHVWARGRGRKDTLIILERLHALLHDGALPLDGHTLVHARVESAVARPLEDGLTYEGEMQARIVTQDT